MPTAGQIEQLLFSLAPGGGALDWDNVGLLVGDPTAEVHRVLVSLDITQEVAQEAAAIGAELIAAHHPVMNCTWQPVQSLREDRPQGRLLRYLVQHHLSAVCMHTNLDVAPGGVNDVLAEALKLVDPGPFVPDGLGRIGTVNDGPTDLQSFVRRVSDALGCNGVRFADGGRPVFRVAVGGGACGEYLQLAAEMGCDTFVTADFKYHDFLNARPYGINLIDAGHFPTENGVCTVLEHTLRTAFPKLEVCRSAVHREVIQYYVKGE